MFTVRYALIPFIKQTNFVFRGLSRVLPETLIGSQLFKKFSTFYKARKFITAFTRFRYLFLSWER